MEELLELLRAVPGWWGVRAPPWCLMLGRHGSQTLQVPGGTPGSKRGKLRDVGFHSVKKDLLSFDFPAVQSVILSEREFCLKKCLIGSC